MHIHLSSESSDICRLLASPRSLPILSSSLLHSLRRPPYLPSYSSLSLSLSFSLLLTFFLFISLLLTLFLRPVSPYCEELPSSVIVRETMRILGRSARYARRCRLDCLRRGLSKPRGVTRWDTVNQAFAYRIFDLRPGDALAVTGRAEPSRAASRRVGRSAWTRKCTRCIERSPGWPYAE